MQAGSLRPSMSPSLPEIGLAAHLAGWLRRFTPKKQITLMVFLASISLLEMDFYASLCRLMGVKKFFLISHWSQGLVPYHS